MKNLPQTYINECSKDILYVLNYLKPEVPFLKEKLIAGEVDGTQYEGDCACLLGTLGKKLEDGADGVCKIVPFYKKDVKNPGEQWFLNIRRGDKPSDNAFSKHAVGLCNMILGLPLEDGVEEKIEVVEIDGKKYRKSDVEDRLKELETI